VISTGDKIRIALAPAHLALGAALVWQFVRGARTPMVLVMRLLFIAYGGYRVALIRRSLRKRR
jgi:hypothetical protein